MYSLWLCASAGTRCALVAHRYTYSPRCRTSLYLLTFILSQFLCGTILLTIFSMVWHGRVSRVGSMLFIGLSCFILFVGLGSLDWYSVDDSLLALHCRPLLIIIRRNITIGWYNDCEISYGKNDSTRKLHRIPFNARNWCWLYICVLFSGHSYAKLNHTTYA